ncbi:hypothetical protein EDB86DRAFT_3078885 [Lactarius hatsudake]|nr:hypothetical protein EDB86DRAFT_3078885 [Lactarius hatsudake]
MASSTEKGVEDQSPSSPPEYWTPLDNSTRNLLELLPNELIAKILAMLHYRDLYSCTRVCRRMVDIIGGSALLQYHLELGRSGMEDGPLSVLSIPERRERLRSYNDAWKHLRWSTCIELPNTERRHNMDVSPGGILTFASGTEREGKLVLVQIPSILRGIPKRQWELSFSFTPYARALDPSEDILVVMEPPLNPFGPYEIAVSLLSQSRHLMRSLGAYFKLRVVQNFLAIMNPKRELCVCNWKTGQIVLMSSTLGDLAKDVILGPYGHRPVLEVYDLDRVSASQHEGVPTPIAVFALEVGDEFDSDPVEELHYYLNIHSYSDEVAVPFFSSPSEQLVALGTHSFPQIECCPILLIPMIRLTSHIDGASSDNVLMRYIPWKDWGATGTGWAPDRLWDYFLGSRQVSGSRLVPGRQQNFVDVWDFSHTRVAQLEPACHQGFLPSVKKSVALPIQMRGLELETVAISEDALICQMLAHLTACLLFADPQERHVDLAYSSYQALTADSQVVFTKKCLSLLAGADIQFRRPNRLDVCLVQNHPIVLVFLPASDIPSFVGKGNVDLGITGHDVILEAQVEAHRIVTSFEVLAGHFFADVDQRAGVENDDARTQIEYVGGSVEAACALGLADGIVDLVGASQVGTQSDRPHTESGETMRAAGLRPIATLLQSEAVLIRSSTPKHAHLAPLIDKITARIAGVIAAGKYVICQYNVRRATLSTATAITPGRRAPTISPLEDPEWVAVSSMVERFKMADAMDQLVSAGAEDILIFNLDNSRRDQRSGGRT